MQYLIYSTHHVYDVDAIIATIFQKDRLRLREAKELAKFSLLIIRGTEI